MVLCSGCPRSYHYACLDRDFKAKSKSKMHFHCPQHQCADCEQNTTNAGGMLYRCRWCERGYCEDCLDWDKTDLIGENLKEYELLGFSKVAQAFYIKCPNCHDHHNEDDHARKFCEREVAKIDKRHQKVVEKQALIEAAAAVTTKTSTPPTPAESWTSATTLESSGITTPRFAGLDEATLTSSRKRKAALGSLGITTACVARLDDTGSAGSRKRKAAQAALSSFKQSPTKRSQRSSLSAITS